MNSRSVADGPHIGRPVGSTEHTWCRSVQAGTGVTVVALLLNRPIALQILQSTIDKLLASHPILRTHLTTTTTKTSRVPFLSVAASPSVTLTSVAAADVFTASPPTPTPPLSHFHCILEHELNQNPWSESADLTPVLFVTVYEMPEPGRLVLALRLHAAVCDWASAGVVLRDLWGLLGRSEMEAAKHDEGGGGGGVLPAMEDLMAKEGARKSIWAHGKDLVRYSLNGLRTSTIRFMDTASRRTSAVARLVLSVDETQKLLTACKLKGVELCGVMSAAAIIAAHSSKQVEDGQHKNYGVVTLIDCRKHLHPILDDRTIGLYYSAIINSESYDGGEGLWDLASKCHNSFSNAKNKKKHLKDIGELSYLMCKAIDNPHLTWSSAQRTGLISVFEEPTVYRSSEVHWPEIGVEDYVGCASVHGVGPTIAFYETIRDGQLDCTCVYPTPLHSREQIHELVEHMKKILIEH